MGAVISAALQSAFEKRPLVQGAWFDPAEKRSLRAVYGANEVAQRDELAMGNSRKRGPNGTRQAQLWRALKAHGPLMAKDAAAIVGCEVEEARRAMLYLVKRGFVGVDRSRYRQHLFAANGVREPQDRRGKPAACRNCRGAKAYARLLQNLRKAHPEKIRRPAGTELERLWKPPTAA